MAVSVAGPIWVNDRLVSPTEPAVSAYDHGFVVGDGVFEVIEVVNSVAFAFRRHLDRLARSASGLGLAAPDREQIHSAVAAVLEAAGLERGIIRITWTAGLGPLGSGRYSGQPTLVVACADRPHHPDSESVVVVPWTRNEKGALTGLKTTSYGENVRALAYAQSRGGGEAIFFNTAGELCEGTGTNIFLGLGGNLVTPPLTSGCLDGITRALIIEELSGSSTVVERTLGAADLSAATEAFLASTTRLVQPIAEIDGRQLAHAPGPLTKAAAAAFGDLQARTDDP